MRRKRTIQKKFFYGYLLIFSVSLILLNLVMNSILYKNSEDIIKIDMENTQKYSREYIKQYLLLNNYQEDVFQSAGNLLVQELSQNFQVNVSIYEVNGQFISEATGGKEYTALSTKPSQLLLNSSDEDLLLATNNKAGFTINQIDQQSIVNFSYPLYINGDHYGIVRFTKDYSTLFQSNQNIVTSLTVFTLFLFLAIFLFSYFLSRSIIQPLTKVTKSMDEVANGNYDTNVVVKTGDEIEILNDCFNDMKNQIKEQFEVINLEKEKVEKLEKNRREFFNNVTHELKTPLTTISGYSQILAEETFNDLIFLKKAATRIKSESDRLHQMVVEVIELSKQQTFEMKKLDLSQLTKQLSEDMQLKAAKYNMKIEFSGKPLFVYGVENRLLEVIINLLDNAIKYGDPNSIILVTTFSQSNRAILKIRNACQNFNSSILEKAFEPFFRGSHTSKDEKGSSGLGLYICKQNIDLHHGTIELNEESGQITFTINLPLWQ